MVRRCRATGELAFYRCSTPRPVPLARPVRVAGQRGRIEEAIQTGKAGDSELVVMVAGAGAVWAVSHDQAILLRIDPGSGRGGPPDPAGMGPAWGRLRAGRLWVALNH